MDGLIFISPYICEVCFWSTEHKGHGFPGEYDCPQCSEHPAPLKPKYGLMF